VGKCNYCGRYQYQSAGSQWCEDGHKNLPDYWQRTVEAAMSEDSWRFGQAAFNVLAEVRPDLAEQVRGESADPFYAERMSDKRMRQFALFLAANW
jgi:hypothetical protein